MLCEGTPISFYIQLLGAYLQQEDKTIDGAKSYIGADDETFQELMKNSEFKRLIDLITVR